MSGDADIPETPLQEPEEGESTIDRRNFLRAAGMYSGTFAIGAAALREQKKGKPKNAHRATGTRPGARASRVHPVTLLNGVTIPVADWVVEENARPGTLDWVVTYPGMLYGYCDHVSATQGEKVTLYIDAGPFAYHVELYRAGYYGGTGGRLVWTSSDTGGADAAAPDGGAGDEHGRVRLGAFPLGDHRGGLAAGLLPLQGRGRGPRERQRLRAAHRARRHQSCGLHDHERSHHLAGVQHVGRALALRRPGPGGHALASGVV